MLSQDILFIILHYSPWDTLEQIAPVNIHHLKCVQNYLHIYPHRINDLMVLLRLFPHASWDYHNLSANPSITTFFVESIIKHLANAPYLLNLSNIFDNFDLARNSAVTWELVCKYPLVPWNWKALTSNPNITWNIINAHPDKDWDKDVAHVKFLWENPSGTNCNSVSGGSVGLSSCVGCTGATGPRGDSISKKDLKPPESLGMKEDDLTWDIVYAHRHLDWSFRDLSKNPFRARQKMRPTK